MILPRFIARVRWLSSVLAALALAASLRAQSYEFRTFAQVGPTGGLVLDRSGNLYATMLYGNAVLKISPGGLVTTLAGRSDRGSTDGIGAEARFYTPEGIAIDRDGNLFVVDTGNFTVRKITPDGVVSTFAGRAGEAAFVDGPVASARLRAPRGIAIDAAGNLFVGDHITIRKITPAGIVSTFVGSFERIGFADGTGAAAVLQTPVGMAFDSAGNLWISEQDNQCIRKISPVGVVTTVAGYAPNCGSSDGVGNQARFEIPWGVTFGPGDKLFVADCINGFCRRVSIDGAVVTIGGKKGAFPGVDGIGAEAALVMPRSITAGVGGALYVGDYYSIKRAIPTDDLVFTIQPQSINVAAGSPAVFRATATGLPPLAYQWRKDGVPITGATSPTLTLPRTQPADAGQYSVVVASPQGSRTSTVGVLTVAASLANDGFSDAQTLTTASGTISGHNVGATGEPLEPSHYGYPQVTASSVWYRWTAPQTGTAVLDVRSPSLHEDMGLAAYTGSTLATLVPVPGWDFAKSRLTFRAVAGTTYSLVAGSLNSSERRNFTLAWHIIPNDDFANAQVITGASGTITGDTEGATSEFNEPISYIGTSTIWYRWTAPQSGPVIFDTLGTEIDTAGGVGTGDSVSTWNVIMNGNSHRHDFPEYNYDNRMVVNAVAGTTYSIAVSAAFDFLAGPIRLNWNMPSGPVLPANPALLVQRTGEWSDQHLTVSAGTAVNVAGYAMSAQPLTVQWRRDGVPLANATNYAFVLDHVQPSDSGDYTVVFSSTAGTVIGGPVRLTVFSALTNDNFADAQELVGLRGEAQGNNLHATGEAGEPIHWNAAGTASSVWYRWTAPASGRVEFVTLISAFDPVMAVYTGTSLATLTQIAQDDDGYAFIRGASLLRFAVSAGTTYRIAIGSAVQGSGGDLRFEWQLVPGLAIYSQPVSQNVAAGDTAIFRVAATDADASATYQWSRDGIPIPGATGAVLTLPNVAIGADAIITVAITNSTGSIVSQPATLTVAAPALTRLNHRSSRIGGGQLWSIAAGDDRLAAVGDGGLILRSFDDGLTWTPADSGTNLWLVGVTYGEGTFVAVGDRGVILVSSDTQTWRSVASGTTQRLNNVLHSPNGFLAVGEGGVILESPNGVLWFPRSSGVNTWLRGIAYHRALAEFVVTGQGGVILHSADAITWERLRPPGLAADLEAVVAVDSYAHFVAIGQAGVAAALTHDRTVLKDRSVAQNWSVKLGALPATLRFRGLAAGASALFATGENGRVITAPDGAGPWFTLSSGTTANLLGGIYHHDTLFVVGENETVLQSDPIYSSRLINISTRGQIGTGANVMITGFVVTGDRPKPMLVRAVGPTLATAFGLAGTLASPVLSLVDAGNRTVGTNTGWTNNPSAAAIAATAARVGAFPFATGSADSALLGTLSPGAYTALVSGTNNSSGLAIVEVYDAEMLDNASARAINISTRGVAGSGQNRMIVGFFIDGASSRRLLIRAVGPALAAAPFNVAGTLAEPQLELYNSRNLPQATAASWNLQPNADEIRSAAKAVGAFDLPEGGKDAAMLVTLLPGAWTVQVGGSTTGVVLVEVYALP